MKHIVHLSAENRLAPVGRILAETARAALEFSQADPGDMSLALVGEEQIQDLNRQFAGHDFPTDVLSFPDDSNDPESDRRYFGDVIIAVPIAAKQAEQSGHSLQAELTLLTVHGVLHLLGFDHDSPTQKKAMWSIQSEILQHLDCAITSPKEHA